MSCLPGIIKHVTAKAPTYPFENLSKHVQSCCGKPFTPKGYSAGSKLSAQGEGHYLPPLREVIFINVFCEYTTCIINLMEIELVLFKNTNHSLCF